MKLLAYAAPALGHSGQTDPPAGTAASRPQAARRRRTPYILTVDLNELYRTGRTRRDSAAAWGN